MRALAALAAAATVVVGCGGRDESGLRPQSPDTTTVATTRTTSVRPDEPTGARLSLQLVGRFDQPLYVTAPREDRSRLFVVEKQGRIRVVRDGKVLRRPFLSLRGKVSQRTEQGLLSLAFAPSYRRTRLFYVSYTDRRGYVRFEEWKASRGSADRADRSTRRLVLRIRHPRPTHNGGHMVFGPDGRLYIGVGDGGGPGDPRRNGQNRGVLLGKLLRIDPRRDGRRRYHVPSTNPFMRVAGARDEIFALGLRNPWRFSFDRLSGALVLGDVGQETFEELDYRPRGRVAGANFGWSAFEGNRRFNRRIRARGAIAPIHTYGRDRGCSVIAGYVVRDPALPRLRGRLLYGDFCSGQISSIVPRAPRGRDPRREHLKVDLLSSFGEDGEGHIYVTSLTGPVYRLVAR